MSTRALLADLLSSVALLLFIMTVLQVDAAHLVTFAPASECLRQEFPQAGKGLCCSELGSWQCQPKGKYYGIIIVAVLHGFHQASTNEKRRIHNCTIKQQASWNW